MALVDSRDGRNFDYGRQLSYAGPQALRNLFGRGHVLSIERYTQRFLADYARANKRRQRPRYRETHCVCGQRRFPTDKLTLSIDSRRGGSDIGGVIALGRADDYGASERALDYPFPRRVGAEE